MSGRPAAGKVDRLWRIWYALMVLALQAYLLYACFQRYAAFRSRALREQWGVGPMNFHLAAGITAALLLPLFLYAAFLRTGNFAEGGVQIGRDRDSLRAAVAEAVRGRGASGGGSGVCAGHLRRHFMPYTCGLHLLMAMCLLVPAPVLQADEVQHGQIGRDQVWRTNVDFLFRPPAPGANAVSAEMFNLALALAVLVVRYPAVFWFSNRIFSLLFSFILCVCGLHVVLAYEATSVLYRASATDSAPAAVNIAPSVILALNVAADILLLLANAAFFEFGYAQVLANLRKYRHYLQLEAPSSGSSDRSNGSSCGSDETPCWQNYAPHLVGILLMVLAVLCKAPVFWDWVGLYRTGQYPIMLAASISGCVYLLLWVAVWFLLGCKTTWQFNIRLVVDFPQNKLSSPQGFHDSHQSLTRGGQPSGVPERRSPPSSSADSDLSKKSNQYVFVQRPGEGPMAMIPTVSEQVDNASENSYACGAGGGNGGGGGGGGGGTLDRQAGLVKYQVRRNSAQMSANNSLKRNALLARTKSGNRVTFKERHETIPGSPGSSQNTSSDSGIEASRICSGQQQPGSVSLQISLNDDYARVNKQPRAASRQSNFDDYPMLGCLFNQQDPAALALPSEYYQTDPYGRPMPGVPVLPPPPAGYGAMAASAASAGDFSMQGDPYGAHAEYRAHGVPVPDILLSRSPFASLGRPASASKPMSPADFYEMQLQQHHHLQQQQQLHAMTGSYGSLQQSMQQQQQQQLPADQVVEGLCSQV